MKKILLVTGFAAIAVSTPAYALYPYITPLPISELQCHTNRGSNTYSFVAHWGVLVDPKLPHPRLVDPGTGKYWPTYSVALKSVGAQCTVPNGGAVNCGGAATCSIVVTCPLKATGTAVWVVGAGIGSTRQTIEGGRKPAGCD